jgi:hypothetical protein
MIKFTLFLFFVSVTPAMLPMDAATVVLPAYWATSSESNKVGLGKELVDLACAGYWDGVKDLVVRGADVNQADVNGETALMCAVFFEDTETVSVLLNAQANPHMQNRKGETALEIAIGKGNLRICIMVIDSMLREEIIDAEMRQASKEEVSTDTFLSCFSKMPDQNINWGIIFKPTLQATIDEILAQIQKIDNDGLKQKLREKYSRIGWLLKRLVMG